jgi:hypothetical protein
MARTCRLVRAGRSTDAQWRREGESLVVSPAGAPALVIRLAEVSGIAGDGFTVRLRLPEGEIALERLGGDGPTLLEALRRDWLPLRAAVLRLAGGESPGDVYAGSCSAAGVRGPFRGFIARDRLVIAPEGGDVTALFVADFATLHFDEESYALKATGWDGSETVFGKLGARAAQFSAALGGLREELSLVAAATLAEFLPSLDPSLRAALAQQWLPGRLQSFEQLECAAPGFAATFAASWLAATPRADSGRSLMAGCAPRDRFLAYSRPAGVEIPSLWLLVRPGSAASLELLSHGDYATYLFKDGEELPGLVEGLVRLPDFSREALYLPIEELTAERSDFAIPARDLPLLRDLRARFAGRKIHTPAAAG